MDSKQLPRSAESIDNQASKLRDLVVENIPTGSSNASTRRFVSLYYADVPPEDLLDRDPATLAVAAQGEIHDERLFMGIAEAMGARGNTSCLVGTPEQVAESCLEYYKLGVEGILLRGFDPLNDALEFGRELIPRIREGAAAIDAERAQVRAAE